MNTQKMGLIRQTLSSVLLKLKAWESPLHFLYFLLEFASTHIRRVFDHANPFMNICLIGDQMKTDFKKIKLFYTLLLTSNFTPKLWKNMCQNVTWADWPGYQWVKTANIFHTLSGCESSISHICYILYSRVSTLQRSSIPISNKMRQTLGVGLFLFMRDTALRCGSGLFCNECFLYNSFVPFLSFSLSLLHAHTLNSSSSERLHVSESAHIDINNDGCHIDSVVENNPFIFLVFTVIDFFKQWQWQK